MKKLQNLKGIGLYCGNDQDIIINKNNFLYFTSVENLLTSLQKANKYDFIVIIYVTCLLFNVKRP